MTRRVAFIVAVILLVFSWGTLLADRARAQEGPSKKAAARAPRLPTLLPPATKGLTSKQPAKISVPGRKAIRLVEGETWQGLPWIVQGARIYSEPADVQTKVSKPLGRNQLEFSVKQEGLVAIAVSWMGAGSKDPAEQKAALRQKRLLETGWTHIGTARMVRKTPFADRHFIFTRPMKAGETVRFHTRGLLAPFAIELTEHQAVALLAVNTRLHGINDIDPTGRVETGLPVGTPPTLVLDTHSPSGGSLNHRFERLQNRLPLEIAREGLLLAAREELRIATRDRTLREWSASVPKPDPLSLPVAMMLSLGSAGDVQMTVFRYRKRNPSELKYPHKDFHKILWERRIKVSPDDAIEQIATDVERLIRTQFPEVLRRAGFDGTPNKHSTQHDVPAEASSELAQLSIIPQFNAARRLHAEVREHGESPELLAALARAYAHLGSLTAAHHSPASKSYSARGLLYAERLVAREQASARSLWQRAYVRAFVGRHAAALADIDKAKKTKSDESPPSWAGVLESFCRYDEAALSAAIEDESTGPLASYFNMLALELCGYNKVVAVACSQVLDFHPGCYRAMDLLSQLRSLGIQRMATAQAHQYFSRTLYDQVLRTPQLPDDVRNKITEFQNDGTELDDEILFRAELIDALRNASQPTQDHHEPSLSVLAALILENSFRQSHMLLRFQKKMLAVSAVETLALVEPLTSKHPYGFALNYFGENPDEAKLSKPEAFKQFSWHEVTIGDRTLHDYIGATRSHTLIGYGYLDDTYRDLTLQMWWRQHAGNRYQPKAEPHVTRKLAKVSPGFPNTITYALYYDWEHAKRNIAEWEQQHPTNTPIQLAVAKAYAAHDQEEEAIRSLNKLIGVSPERAPYTALAKIYRDQKKYDLWQETLDELLELPAPGLENATISRDLANHFMDKREWERAKPYADRAAQSYSSWGLMAAAKCYEGLGDLDKAEQLTRANSRRYTNASLRWFEFCARTGHGDYPAAQQHAQQYVNTLRGPPSDSVLAQIATFYTCIGEKQKAYELFKSQSDKRLVGRFKPLTTAALADELGQHDVRDAILAKFTAPIKIQKKTVDGKPVAIVSGYPLRHLATLIRRDLENGDKPFDTTAFEELAALLSDLYYADMAYYVGRHLTAHGDVELGRKYLKQSVAIVQPNSLASVLAGLALREHKIDVIPSRDAPKRTRFKGTIEWKRLPYPKKASKK